MTGHIVSLIRPRGLGFVKLDSGGQALFHRSQVVDNYDQLAEGDLVSCNVVEGVRGLLAAKVQQLAAGKDKAEAAISEVA